VIAFKPQVAGCTAPWGFLFLREGTGNEDEDAFMKLRRWQAGLPLSMAARLLSCIAVCPEENLTSTPFELIG
jgi:hypothetical protein